MSKQDKVKATNFEKLPKIRFWNFARNFTRHLLKLLNKMYKYEMDPTRTVGATERTRDVGRADGQTDRWKNGRRDGVKPIYPPTTLLLRGYNDAFIDIFVMGLDSTAIATAEFQLRFIGDMGDQVVMRLWSIRSSSDLFVHWTDRHGCLCKGVNRWRSWWSWRSVRDQSAIN